MSEKDAEVHVVREREFKRDALSFLAESNDWDETVKLYLRCKTRWPGEDPHSTFSVPAGPLVFRSISRDELSIYSLDPVLKITRFEASELMDTLWKIGVRPTKNTLHQLPLQQNAQIEAYRGWLKDMRHLAFKGNPPK